LRSLRPPDPRRRRPRCRPLRRGWGAGIACERSQTTRMPAGPTSRARERENASTAAQADAAPPIRRAGVRPGTAVNVTITPEEQHIHPPLASLSFVQTPPPPGTDRPSLDLQLLLVAAANATPASVAARRESRAIRPRLRPQRRGRIRWSRRSRSRWSACRGAARRLGQSSSTAPTAPSSTARPLLSTSSTASLGCVVTRSCKSVIA
jgi:hypothetical protein